FRLPDALLNVLDSYAIDRGERGELLVSTFFTWAWDLYVRQIEQFFPHKPTRFCPVFSVLDLLSCLFYPDHFHTMSNSLPSVCCAGFFSPKTFEDMFGNTKMHFNHMMQPFGTELISHLYLLKIMARGAAALGANCQPGYDMIYLFLYGTSDLIIDKVGFIMVQVKNHTNHMAPQSQFFKAMDPFRCHLVKEADNLAIPIVRIVFSLGRDQSAKNFDKAGHPIFTSYDFWCSGIGPGLLQPVDEDNQNKWKTLLGETDKFDGVFSKSKAPDVRMSQCPGGGEDDAHYDAWMGAVE
ncbi:hypothetical protein V8E53_008031, partial [Lactarius tabidus]